MRVFKKCGKQGCPCSADMMIIRIAVIAAVLVTFVALGTPWSNPAVALQPLSLIHI